MAGDAEAKTSESLIRAHAAEQREVRYSSRYSLSCYARRERKRKGGTYPPTSFKPFLDNAFSRRDFGGPGNGVEDSPLFATLPSSPPASSVLVLEAAVPSAHINSSSSSLAS